MAEREEPRVPGTTDHQRDTGAPVRRALPGVLPPHPGLRGTPASQRPRTPPTSSPTCSPPPGGGSISCPMPRRIGCGCTAWPSGWSPDAAGRPGGWVRLTARLRADLVPGTGSARPGQPGSSQPGPGQPGPGQPGPGQPGLRDAMSDRGAGRARPALRPGARSAPASALGRAVPRRRGPGPRAAQPTRWRSACTGPRPGCAASCPPLNRAATEAPWHRARWHRAPPLSAPTRRAGTGPCH